MNGVVGTGFSRGRHGRLRSAAIAVGALLSSVVIVTMPGAAVVHAAPILVVDDGGADDYPGQKDLSFLTTDTATAGTLAVTWGWDDTAWSGNNTGDACGLFDTDGDGKANYAMCVTVGGTPAVQQSVRMYSCGDGKADRCTQKTTLISPFGSTATTSRPVNSDPFGVFSSLDYNPLHVTGNTCDQRPSCYTDDTVANVTIQLSDFGAATAKLLNVCSYPSQEPNSDPSECVITPNAGFLTIIKAAPAGTDATFTMNASAPSTNGDSSWSINGPGTVVSLVPYPAGNTLDLSEVLPSGWQLNAVSCVIQSSPTSNTGTPTPASAPFTGINNLTITSGLETRCTFTNGLIPAPSLSIVKGDNDATFDSVGDVITYSIVATNTGNVTLASVTVTDTLATLGTCVPVNGSSLAPGASMTCSATHTIVQADIDAGSYLNTACVDDGANGAAQACEDESTPGDKNPSLSIVKGDNDATFDSVGDVITYSIVATNNGNTTLAAVTVTDTLATLGTCVPVNGSSLAPGASMTCSATHTIVQADIDAGTYLNTACVDDGANGAAQACEDESTPGDKNPSLSIVKGDNDATFDSVGDVITYSIVATNNGNTTLAAVTVTDTLATLGTCVPVNGSSLAPGASMTCSATHTIVQADIDAGTYLNTACVDDGANGAAQACEDESTPGDKNPSLSIVKGDNDATYDSVGDVITYSIVATNNGNTTLAAVTVTDTLATLGTCVPVNGSSLAPGASMTCSATHTIVQADIDAGTYLNTACVDDGANGAAQACEDESTPGDKNPSLSIVKGDGDATFDSVGDVITYSIVATNNGNTTLAAVTVTDTLATLGTCVPVNGSSLAPGASMTCSATHTIVQADIDAGTYLNTACVDDGANGAAQACEDESTPGDKNPSLSIVKGDNDATFDSVGDVITYSIVATNTGNVTLASVTVTDTLATLGTCVPVNGSSLAPGASMTCSATHTIVQADIDAGSYLNTACVDDGANGAAQACEDESTPGDKNPSLSIVKGDNDATYDSVGDVITYSIVATNNGNTTLAAVTVTDTLATLGTCVPVNGSSLAPGASMTCSATHTIVQADIDAGTYLNTACVDDGANGAAQACEDESTPGDKNPSLSIVKGDNDATFDSVGDVITYSIVATNTGNVTLASVTVTDTLATLGTCVPVNGSSLAPGASMTCSATHTIVQADIDAGTYLNTACVDDGANGAAQACEDESTPGDKNPSLSITKDDTEQSFSAVGQVVHYTIVATNDGNVTLASVTVTDPGAVGLTCTPANGSSLAPGASMTCSASHTITQADIDAGHYLNTACVDDGPDGATEDCAPVDTPHSQSAQIAPTATTCQNFRDGVAADLEQLLYGVKGGKINNVSPGVLFYYAFVTVTQGQEITVTQSDGGTKLLAVQQGQAFLYNSVTCTKVATGTATSTGSLVTFSNVPAGTYIIGIKYTPDSVKGEPDPGGDVLYTFQTLVNGVLLSSNTDTVTLHKKQ